jgi:glutaredoxin
MKYLVLILFLLIIPGHSSIDSYSTKPSSTESHSVSSKEPTSKKSSSGIFKWVDEKGLLHFSDEPPGDNDFVEIKLKEISTYKSVSYSTSKIDVGKKVIMYSASWCGACKKAKNYFNRKGIRFTEYDIEKSARAKRQFAQLGAKGVPVIIVKDGVAEECFRASLKVAASQSALSLELRGAISLAKLLAGSGRKSEARQLVENTLCRFTEGFESADFHDANSLLNTL